ncbi:MAG: FxLYD domain-containing protein [Ruminococcus sp.]|nr:FxLYD domain-containing protein [Ruminococcus sp.]
MKKTLCLLLAVILSLSAVVFAGCGNDGDNSSAASDAKSSAASTDTDTDTDTEKETLSSDMQAIADSLDVKEYRVTGLEYEHIVFVITNNSKTDCALEVDVNFYDKDKNVVDTQDEQLEAIGAGQTSVMAVYANEKFESYTYDFIPYESSYYVAVTKDLDLKVEEGDNKLTASVTNNGTATALFTTVNTLFFKGDEVLYFDKSYVGDDNTEIAPDKTETKEIMNFTDSDRYETYLNSYAKAE